MVIGNGCNGYFGLNSHNICWCTSILKSNHELFEEIWKERVKVNFSSPWSRDYSSSTVQWRSVHPPLYFHSPSFICEHGAPPLWWSWEPPLTSALVHLIHFLRFTWFTSWGSETKLRVLLFSVLWALSSSLCVIIMGTDINLCFGGASNTVYPALYINRCSLQFVSLAVGEEGFCVWVTVVQMYHRLVLLVNALWDSMADSLMEKSVRHALYIHHCYMGRRTCLLLS